MIHTQWPPPPSKGCCEAKGREQRKGSSIGNWSSAAASASVWHQCVANEVGKGVADDSADEWSHWTICTPISIYSTVEVLHVSLASRAQRINFVSTTSFDPSIFSSRPRNILLLLLCFCYCANAVLVLSFIKVSPFWCRFLLENKTKALAFIFK